MQETSLVFTIAVSLSLACLLGFIAFKLRLSPIVGYLLAGVCISPHTPGLVANSRLATELSEIGVILLMFGVGLHFSTKDLMAVSRVALLGALPQTALSAVCGALMASLWGWPWGSCFLFGLSLSIASTIVVLSELEKRRLVQQAEGKTCVGWLLSQDLLTVLILALLPALSPMLSAPQFDSSQLGAVLPSFGIAAVKGAVFICVMLFAGRRVFPWLMNTVAKTGSRELFTLFVIGIPIGVSLLAAHLFGVSFALGAFLAGMVLNESDLSHHAAAKALPLQDAFAVLFFVATGMAFKPTILLTHTWHVLAAVGFAIVVTPLIAFLLITLLLRYTVRIAAVVSASIAQIGEFSLVIATLGLQLHILPEHAYATIIGAVLISIFLHSATFPLLEQLATRPAVGRLLTKVATRDPLTKLARAEDVMTDHVVLIGYGRVGSVIGAALRERSVPFVVVEENRDIAARLRSDGIPCIYGSADIPEVLSEAQVTAARVVAITAPDALSMRIICDHIKSLNPNATIIVRTHSEDEMRYLQSQKQIALAVFGEIELAKSISEEVLKRMEVSG